MENKQDICNLLSIALKATDNCRDLLAIEYHKDKDAETVDVVFAGGRRTVNVAMDSGTSMIRDIMMNLGV